MQLALNNVGGIMATRTVEKIEREIAILKDKLANLIERLEKIQSKCSHQYKRRKISNTMEICERCHEEIMIPPTTSRFPPDTFKR